MVASVENVIPVSSLKKLEKGCYFPASVFAMDILGNVVEEAGLGQEMGEPDRTCVPVLGSLTPSAADPEFIRSDAPDHGR
ncbi:gamma-Glu-putrescine synthase [Escherichia coli]|uniref:Gamma-Glu-putrescine synthase n=1 Tax=Escherichia coli TaxID=562 RepID=A0A376KVR7_ECOLX|nr:gamma-Glu-putrescine synthase [Escherichia coli]